MKRSLPILLTAILLLTAGGSFFWWINSREAPELIEPPSFDYASADSWAVRPVSPPPAVWEAGWDLDVVLLSAETAIDAGTADSFERSLGKSRNALENMATAFESIGPVYAPVVRQHELAPDLSAALSAYLANDNRGRAFVVATDSLLPPDFAATLANDPLLRDRFAGVLALEETAGFAPDTNKAEVCSRRYEQATGCTLQAPLRKAGNTYALEGDAEKGGVLVQGFTAWLRDHGSKLAEPLGDLEEIEIIDIQKPQEGDLD